MARRWHFSAAYDASNCEVWRLKVYDNPRHPELEGDVQDVWFRSLRAEGGKLLIENERGERFEVDPADTARLRPPGAGPRHHHLFAGQRFPDPRADCRRPGRRSATTHGRPPTRASFARRPPPLRRREPGARQWKVTRLPRQTKALCFEEARDACAATAINVRCTEYSASVASASRCARRQQRERLAGGAGMQQGAVTGAFQRRSRGSKVMMRSSESVRRVRSRGAATAPVRGWPAPARRSAAGSACLRRGRRRCSCPACGVAHVVEQVVGDPQRVPSSMP
ncbi:hypothetical protein RLIN73S_04453 [Rhodanobacter lindaniclasticus]